MNKEKCVNTNNAKKRKRSTKIKYNTRVLYSILFTILTLYIISMMLLILWGIFTSVKTNQEFRENPLLMPKGAPWTWKWSNISYVMQQFKVEVVTEGGIPKKIGFVSMLINTLEYSIGGALISTMVPCIVAYAVTKFNYKFNKVILGVVIVSMILPIIGSAPSEIQLLRKLGLFNTMVGSYVQRFHFLGSFFLIFCASFRAIPKDYAEAAYIDGASEFRVMWQIIIPLLLGVIGTVFLMKFIEQWNDYQLPYLYMPERPTLAYGMYMLSRSSERELSTVPMRLAGCMILLLPILVIFISCRKVFMVNLSMGGIKG